MSKDRLAWVWTRSLCIPERPTVVSTSEHALTIHRTRKMLVNRGSDSSRVSNGVPQSLLQLPGMWCDHQSRTPSTHVYKPSLDACKERCQRRRCRCFHFHPSFYREHRPWSRYANETGGRCSVFSSDEFIQLRAYPNRSAPVVAFVDSVALPGRVDYLPLYNPSSCSGHELDLPGGTFQNQSLSNCMRRCFRSWLQAPSTWGRNRRATSAALKRLSSALDTKEPFRPTQNCFAVGYNFRTRRCRLRRECTERFNVQVGRCLSASAKRECYFFLRGGINHSMPMKTHLDRIKNRTLRTKAVKWRTALRTRAQLQAVFPQPTICNLSSLLHYESPLATIPRTFRRAWRYYQVLECRNGSVCMTFKTMGKTASLGGMVSSDGITFGKAYDVLKLGPEWREDMFTHNLALLPLGGDEYVMMGGKQGFVSNSTCRSELRAAGFSQSTRPACLLPVSGFMSPSPTGIRLSRGRGLPWDAGRWSQPQTTLTGTHPANCIDRRPEATGYPRLLACEFDGRLSLARVQGVYHLYARANRQSGAVAGGRFVQVTRSQQLERGWSTWAPVQILGLDPKHVDVYFFAVGLNPVDANSVLAVFPLTQPPLACVVAAVSYDGVHFSRPINLLQSPFGVRSAKADGSGAFEWRAEDMPAAGAVRDPNNPGRILFYIHHAVKGTTIRKGAIPHVRAYSVSAKQLTEVTAASLRQLPIPLHLHA